MDSTMPKYVFDSERGYDLLDRSHDAAIWRYMDLPKFLSFLDKRGLFLCRIDSLGDPFEGSAPVSLVNWRSTHPARGLRADDAELIRTRRRNTIVSCWHMNESESVAMWKLYSLTNFGVAIRSTITRLGNCLPKYDGEDVENEQYSADPKVLSLRIGAVRYIVFSTAADLPPHARDLHYYKQASFQHEQELRVVACAYPYRDEMTDHTVFPNRGDLVPVALSILLEAVYVAPQAPSWYFELVSAALERSSLSVPVHQSDLDRDPLF
jgi:hypothetical protein